MPALGLGSLIAAAETDATITAPPTAVTVTLALLSVSGPIHTQIGAILGDRTSGVLRTA